MIISATLLFAAMTVVAMAAPPRWDALEGYTHTQFEADFHKTYASPTERAARARVFEANFAAIQRHNADPAATWKNGVNAFTDLTAAEFKSRLGYKAADKSVHGLPVALKPSTSRSAKRVPDSVDWRSRNVVSPVKDQGQCGSCWAFASTEVVESYVALATGLLFTLSPQQLVSCAPNPNHCGGTGGCLGSVPQLAFDYIAANGFTTEWQYPYTSGQAGVTGNCSYAPSTAVVKVAQFVTLQSNSYDDVLEHVAYTGPLAINVQANVWQSYESGVFNGCTNLSDVDIDHVVQLVGYGSEANNGHDSDYWLVRNSWDVTWGEAGYIKLLRESAPTCGVDPTPQDGTGCGGGPASVRVCGTCGVLYDVSYPTGAARV